MRTGAMLAQQRGGLCSAAVKFPRPAGPTTIATRLHPPYPALPRSTSRRGRCLSGRERRVGRGRRNVAQSHWYRVGSGRDSDLSLLSYRGGAARSSLGITQGRRLNPAPQPIIRGLRPSAPLTLYSLAFVGSSFAWLTRCLVRVSSRLSPSNAPTGLSSALRIALRLRQQAADSLRGDALKCACVLTQNW